MLFNPKTPAHIRKAMTENPTRSGYGWDMDKTICKFKPKYNVGDTVKILVVSNEHINEKYINENTKIEYLVGEVTGYYDVGYGITVFKKIFMKNELYGYYQFPSHHTLHRSWVEDYPFDKNLMEKVMKEIKKYKAFVFR
jgi:hypothetical protein